MFLPGHSGNPKGRPKRDMDLAAMAREHTVEAVQRLVQVLRAEDDARAVQAAQILLDRGWGRPVTPIATNESADSLSVLHLIAARRVAEAIQALADGKAQNTNGPDNAGPPVIDYSVPALE